VDTGDRGLSGAASTQSTHRPELSSGEVSQFQIFQGPTCQCIPWSGEKRPQRSASLRWERCGENLSHFGCVQLNFRSCVWTFQGFDWNWIPFYIFLDVFFSQCVLNTLICPWQIKAHAHQGVMPCWDGDPGVHPPHVSWLRNPDHALTHQPLPQCQQRGTWWESPGRLPTTGAGISWWHW